MFSGHIVKIAEEPLRGQSRSRRKPKPRKRLLVPAAVAGVVVLLAGAAAGPLLKLLKLLKVTVVRIRVKVGLVAKVKVKRIPKEERQILQSNNDCRSYKMRRI